MKIQGVQILPWNKRIEILRRANNFTQIQIAEKCCTNQKCFWQWEKGIIYPNKKHRMLIARAFNVKVSYIFEQN